MGIFETREYKLQYMAQFQPREFSAIIGAEICCVLAEFPLLRPLPLLFRSLPPVPGVVRPPDMKAFAPPRRAGLLDWRISDGFRRELDRR